MLNVLYWGKIPFRALQIMLLTSMLVGCGRTPSPAQNSPEPAITGADRIEVIHFHGNRQCMSCIALGELALKTIKTYFPQEYALGKIVFKTINLDAPENSALVQAFQVRGSSLFFQVTKGARVTRSEDTKVWRLVGDEAAYMTYVAGVLKNYLGA
jgi:hypothetical protein